MAPPSGWGREAAQRRATRPPVLAIGILFGLAMDCQVFLVSRMREEHAHGATALDSVRTGFRHGARVVTAAGLIMISVFASFIVPDEPIIKSIGFAWWLPAWLDRLIPNVDLEGTSLERHEHPSPRPTSEPALGEAG